MSDSSKTLVLFTIEFPFGTKETFLENEIQYYKGAFKNIYIIPTRLGNGIQRELPPEIIVIDKLATTASDFSLQNSTKYFGLFLKTFFFCLIHTNKPINYLKSIKSFLHHFHNDINTINSLREIINSNHLQNALYYDYWLMNKSLSLSFLKKQKLINNIISRTHGFDLYDDRHMEGVVPFKEWKTHHLDHIYTISKHGKQYLDRQFPTLKNKFINSYLGVPPSINTPLITNELLIVSCSALIPLKQVPLIAKAISKIKTPCKWVHFGDGVEMEKVKTLCDTFPTHIDFELKGFTENKRIREFYEKNYISCFISLSKSEGLPVSMMEAQAYSIPIIAPDINGIPEIVNKNTGILLPLDYNLNTVSQSLDSILDASTIFDRDQINDFFDSNFNAEKNYSDFVKELSSLLA